MIAAVILSLGSAASSALRPAQADTVTIGGPFSLTDMHGRSVSERSYHDKWLLVYFGYTFCPDACPTVLNTFGQVLDQLGAEAAKVQPLFISVDPDRDTVPVLAKYMTSFDPRIMGLTGSPAAIAAVADEYGAEFQSHKTAANPDNYTVDHSVYVYLMNPAGKFVRGFNYDASSDEMASGVRKALVAE